MIKKFEFSVIQAKDTFDAHYWDNLPLTNPPSVKASSLSFHRSTTGSDRIRRISSALAIISLIDGLPQVDGLTVLISRVHLGLELPCGLVLDDVQQIG